MHVQTDQLVISFDVPYRSGINCVVRMRLNLAQITARDYLFVF